MLRALALILVAPVPPRSDICTELQNFEDAALAHAQVRAAAGPGAPAQHLASLDPTVQQAVGRALLLLLEDSSTDVQTVSVKCLALLVRRLSAAELLTIVDKL